MKRMPWPRLAGLILMMTVAGCGPSSSPNEANVAGAAVDPATVPQDRDEMVRRQKQKIAEFQKTSSTVQRRSPRGR